MMGRGCSAFLLFLVLSVVAVPQVFAHDGSWEANIVSWDSVLFGHDDATPWKGWATLTVTNTMLERWGDFHFQINEMGSYNVIFPTKVTMLMEDQNGWPYSGYDFVVDPGLKMIDFHFYGNPVDPGERVTFKVYTDNTASQHSWFGLCVWPTPVPEPATVALLGLGAVTVLRIRRK